MDFYFRVEEIILVRRAADNPAHLSTFCNSKVVHFIYLRKQMKKQLIYIIIIFAMFTACRSAAPSSPAVSGETDSESGLPLNPVSPPADSPFIVDGEIASMNIDTLSAPEFVIRIENGKTFRVQAQELSAVTYDDGEPVGVDNLETGMHVRATIFVETSSRESNNLRLLRTNNLTVIR
jgi:hypothetical protein